MPRLPLVAILLVLAALPLRGQDPRAPATPPDSASDAPPPFDDPRNPLPGERYARLWESSAFGINAPPEAAPPPPANPLDGVRLIGVLGREDQPVVLVQRGEGNPVETLAMNRQTGGLDLIEVAFGDKLQDTRVLLAGPGGEGWVRFAESANSLPRNDQEAVSSRRPDQEAETDNNHDNRNRRRSRGRWSAEERQQANERVIGEIERAENLLERAQDPTERKNLEERLERLREFQRRISEDDDNDESGTQN